MSESPLRASFYTLGCRLNQAETSLIANGFRQRGYDVVEFGEVSDVCVINSCTVTEQADAKCRSLVRQVLRKNPETYVAIVGCYSQTGYDVLRQIEGLDLIVGNAEKMRVFEHIGDEPLKAAEPRVVRPRIPRQAFTVDPAPGGADTTRANLKIQDGCDFMCSFCVIPMARGRARSRELDDVRREAEALIAAGHKELVLTGVNIGTYDHEGRGFLELVQMLSGLEGLVRLRISSIEPTTIGEELLEWMAASPVVCPHLHLPLQSGSDSVLERMRRKYDIGEFMRYVERAAALVPQILIATDLIVGFPGESEAEFADSCRALADSPIAYAHIFNYSGRPGTAAQKLEGHLDVHERKRRSRVLHEISNRKKAQFYREMVGRRLRVITEEQQAGLWYGFADNYVRVAIDAPGLGANEVVEVEVVAAESQHVVGRALGDGATALCGDAARAQERDGTVGQAATGPIGIEL